MTKPLFYLWVFHPQTAHVTLTHDWEGHPAHTKTHGDLARELNEPNLYHGYAYRIKGGWRVTDYDHKPVEDPFVKAKVVGALGHAEAPESPPEPPKDHKGPGALPEGGKFHYGLPVP